MIGACRGRFGWPLAVSLATASCTRAPSRNLGMDAGSPPPLAAGATFVTSAPVDAGAVIRDSGNLPDDLNVLLLSIDSLRADQPWAGYPRPIAPRLTELESRSVSFTHAYSMSSYTSMSLGGLLGGRLPSEMRRDGYFFSTYPKDNVMFPEVIQRAGIHTMAAHAHCYFKTAGFDQGFDEYELVPDLKCKNTTDPNVTSPKLEAIAERMLGEPTNDTQRFFAWFHFLDPHDQYLPHEGIGPYGTRARDRYDAEVTFTDQSIGKLLDFVSSRSWASRTAIVVTADHGEAFGEHGRLLHGFEVYEMLVRVPLFFVLPAVNAVPPRRIDVATGAVDLPRTILDLLHVQDLADANGFEGKSLVPDLLGRPHEPRDVVIDLPATSDNDKRRALIHGQLKIIAFGEDRAFQVFDLENDPGELTPMVKGEVFAEMLARYRAHEKSVKEVPAFGCREDCLNGAWAKKKQE